MRTGEKYLQDLQDGRRFLWRGQWIENIASHNRFIHGAIAVSEYYHFQKEHASSQTYSQKDHVQPLSYTTIDSKELLRLRSNAFEKWSTASCGTLSRSPDYMNTVLTAMAQFATEDSTNEFSGHIRSFYQKAKAEDLCLTHTCINWSMNKSADRESDCSSPLKIVEKNSRGLWVSGARSVATLAPYSDWLLCFASYNPHYTHVQTDLAISFATPVHTPGLNWVCRSWDTEEPTIDITCDERDCLAIFDRCFIPWENIFIAGDVKTYNHQSSAMRFLEHAGHHVLIRHLCRLRFLLGIAYLLAETTKANQFFHVQEKLGKIVAYLYTFESLATAAIEDGSFEIATNAFVPSKKAVSAGLSLFPSFFEEIKQVIRELGAAKLVAGLDQASLKAIDEQLSRYLNLSSHRPWQAQLFDLAWHQVASSWAGRESLYESSFFGNRQRLNAATYHSFEKTHVSKLILRQLKILMKTDS